jgi:ribosomal protein L40E
MTEFIFTILVFFGVIAVTAVLFLGWIFFSIVRFFIHSMRGLSGQGNARPQHKMIMMRCARERCAATNPVGARFCRRCGHEMAAGHGAGLSRAAMF